MLDALPSDVLEHVAYYASTETLYGPPAGLVPLLALCRSTSATLRRSANPHLYARIFEAKFDLAAPRRRLARLYGSDTRSIFSVNELADELVRRCIVLKHLRTELDARSSNEPGDSSRADNTIPTAEADARLDELLWTAFLMVLEDAGRNTAQLRNARIEAWLAVFWFDRHGASGAVRRLDVDRWPVTPAYSKDLRLKTRHALGMWLLWFFLDPAAYVANADLYRKAERILKLVMLNAPLYPLSHLPWTSFKPEPPRIHFGLPGASSTEPFDPHRGPDLHLPGAAAEASVPFKYFGRYLPQLTPLPPAVPANLALLALHARSRRNADTIEGGLDLLELLGPSLAEAFIALPSHTIKADRQSMQNSRTDQAEGELGTSQTVKVKDEEPLTFKDGYRWECEWLRSVYAVDMNGVPFSIFPGTSTTRLDRRKYRTFQPGSLEGSWEGTFTYTEFHSFAALLAGAWPSKLQDCLIAQHSQTWRIREYHLLSPSNSEPTSALTERMKEVPLPVGDAKFAHIPQDLGVQDNLEFLRLSLPSDFSPTPSSSSSNEDSLPREYTYKRYRGSSTRRINGDAAGEHDVGEEEDGEPYMSRVQDIILTGEGHSGWGEFRLIGRVRPIDGFVSIMKEYTSGDRGQWLYRGYLVGGGSAAFEGGVESEGEAGSNAGGGYMVGRWRDVLTPAETHGYEGAFAMARRR